MAGARLARLALLLAPLVCGTRMVPHSVQGLLDVVKDIAAPSRVPAASPPGASLAQREQHGAAQRAGAAHSDAAAGLSTLCKEDAAGLTLGCREGCQCGWGQQCYPKWIGTVLPNSSRVAGDGVNRGTCETSVSVLALMSFMLFSLVLTLFVALRTFLQWRALEDTAEPAVLFKTAILTSTPSTSFGSGVKATERSTSTTGPMPGGSAESDTDDKDTDDEQSVDSGDDAEGPDPAKRAAAAHASAGAPAPAAGCEASGGTGVNFDEEHGAVGAATGDASGG